MMWYGNATVQVSLRLDESEWSDKFSLDTVGNVGKIECKIKNQNQMVNSATHCPRKVSTILPDSARKPSVEVTPTILEWRTRQTSKLAVTYLLFPVEVCFTAIIKLISSCWAVVFYCDLELWPMTLAFRLDLNSVKLNQQPLYVGQRMFVEKLLSRHTHLVVLSGPQNWFVHFKNQNNTYHIDHMQDVEVAYWQKLPVEVLICTLA